MCGEGGGGGGGGGNVGGAWGSSPHGNPEGLTGPAFDAYGGVSSGLSDPGSADVGGYGSSPHGNPAGLYGPTHDAYGGRSKGLAMSPAQAEVAGSWGKGLFSSLGYSPGYAPNSFGTHTAFHSGRVTGLVGGLVGNAVTGNFLGSAISGHNLGQMEIAPSMSDPAPEPFGMGGGDVDAGRPSVSPPGPPSFLQPKPKEPTPTPREKEQVLTDRSQLETRPVSTEPPIPSVEPEVWNPPQWKREEMSPDEIDTRNRLLRERELAARERNLEALNAMKSTPTKPTFYKTPPAAARTGAPLQKVLRLPRT
jgi:hypothetical protein